MNSEEGRPGLLSRLRLLAEPALFVAIAGRVWQSLAGLLTLFFIVSYFTPEIQGYHQTFVSLVALQLFVELGIIVAIISSVSHEWAGLGMGDDRAIVGDDEKKGRLAALTRFVAWWFLGAALLLLIGCGAVGAIILSRQGAVEIWLAPWVATIAIASAFLWCQGMIAVIEGCHQILAVAIYRLLQAVVGSLALWVAVSNGAGLWSLAVMTGVNLVCVVVFLTGYYRHFLLSLLRDRTPTTFNWWTDIWPMQWPLALQGVTGYFMLSLFVPVVYVYHGVVEAGRMGISIQVVTAILAVATTWLTVKAPRLGTMYALRESRRFESTWAATSVVSLVVAAAGALTVLAILLWADAADIPAARRFLDPLPFALMLGWGFLLHAVQCAAAYWRAQRREAVGGWGVLPGLVTGLFVWWLGREWGTTGAAAAALGVVALLSMPMSVYFLRKSRHITATRHAA